MGNEDNGELLTIRIQYALPRLELAKLPALEQQLECLPNEGRCALGRVDGVRAEGETSADWLVDVDH